MLRVSYYLHASGNYHVNLIGFGQQISVCPAYFLKQMNSGSVIVGCRDISSELAESLGFVLPVSVKEIVI